MSLREKAMEKGGGKADARRIAMASPAAKRLAPVKKSVVKKPILAKKPAAAKKPAPAKKSAPAKKLIIPAAKPAPAPPSLATPLPVGAQPPKPAAAATKPAVALAPRPGGAAAQSVDERRKAATRRFFARLRSLEAIVGADLRKRGSLVLMQAVDQWYSEAISATATEQSIANAAKAVIAHL
jgi:hypothetical protein